MTRAVRVRPYRATDELDWVRTRAPAFLATSYFDDVIPAKPAYAGGSVELVAVASSSRSLAR